MTQLWLLSGCSRSEIEWKKLQNRITEHYFNHAVEIVVPCAAALPSELSSWLPRYACANLPLARFLQKRQSVEDSLSLTALSLGRVDTGNVFAVLPTGVLVMSVDKDTAEQLGLQGRPSRYLNRHRFNVEVDMMAAEFKLGKPGHNRVQWSVSERLGMEDDFVMCWRAEDAMAMFPQVTTQPCVRETHLLCSLSLPVLDPGQPKGLCRTREEEVFCSAADMHVWIGAISNGLHSVEGQPDEYISRFTLPELGTTCQYGTRTRWSGMIHSEQIVHLITKAKELLLQNSVHPWLVISVWGFEDAPVSWKSHEHGFLLSGDAHYSIVLFPEHFWCFSVIGSHDLLGQ